MILHNEIKALKAEVSFLESKVSRLEILNQSKTQTEPENEEQIEINSVSHDPDQPSRSESNSNKSRKRKIRNSHEDGNCSFIANVKFAAKYKFTF